ncbi:MAG: carbamoyltransferase [Chloroflexota bacterium]|nr:carbamoyltransferase [Chloroflexota bacterium]
MHILGINGAFHDSSACLVRDGVVVAAAEEERFLRLKHHKRATPYNSHALPFHAIDYCLRAGGITLAEVDHVAYSFDPWLLTGGTTERHFALPRDVEEARRGPGYEPWETIFLAGITAAPRMLRDDVPFHLRARFDGDAEALGWRFHFVEHHVAHAASAFYPSPFERAAIMTLDGRGECVSTFLGRGRGTTMEKLNEVELPHSLGFLYERVTSHLGFLNSSDEYKVMALASYGEPRYAGRFRSLLRWREDGGYEIAPFDLTELVGPARPPKAPIEARHFDIASSLQVVLEEACLALAGWLHRRTGEQNLVLAGGVALNCVMNARLARESEFERVWVQPAAGDAGTSLGAALEVWAEQQPGGTGAERWRMESAYLGPEYDDREIAAALDHAKLRYRRCPDIADATAECLARGKIVGWFQGRMEFGPRALGARSIVASPTDPDMMQRMNELKDREDFRPVAPAVLAERAPEYFVGCTDSPFMLFVYRVRPEVAEKVPAVRHVDGTARAQTVSAASAPLFHRLISRFEERSGVPVVVNTSFNTRSRPIVCTPQDALECFYTSPIDVLAIGSYLLVK